MQQSTEHGYDASNERDVAEREKGRKATEARRIDGLRQIMSTANGRLWMWSHLSSCGLFSTAFNGNSKDYFNLGQRNAGMPIFADLHKYFLDEYILMMKENS